ncbi:MAG: hypothetical protein PVH88_01970 [Ignavibacteria bacterium]
MTRKAYEHWGKVINDGRQPLPNNVAYLYSDHPQQPWIAVTWDEVHKERAEIQASNLEYIRRIDTQIKPGFIWVFDNGPIFPYGGKWHYVKTFNEQFPLNFIGEKIELILKCMNLFPCGVLPLIENHELWMKEFIKQYRKPNKRRKKQGLKKVWCKINHNNLIDVFIKSKKVEFNEK